MRALRTLPLLIALAGASVAHADGAAPAEAPFTERDSAAVLAFFNDLVDTAVKHQADCGALATVTGGVVDRHLSTIEMTWALQKAKRKPPKEVTAQMDKRAVEMVGALRTCWSDERLKAAFNRMKPPKDAKQ